MNGFKSANFVHDIFNAFSNTVKLLKRLAGLILFLKLKMRVLLEIGPFYLLNLGIIAGLIRGRALLDFLLYVEFYDN